MYFMFYLWGYTSAFLIYWALSHFFPPTETLLTQTIYGNVETQSLEGVIATRDLEANSGKEEMEAKVSSVA